MRYFSRRQHRTGKSRRNLPPVVDLDSSGKAKYFHFGLESALYRDSPGEFSKQADLIQYASVYMKNPKALPLSL